jgi:demethylmenaquinone methyltransferase/2-methoxy-6-polyprenyl-1,4-benzoquinol methylase
MPISGERSSVLPPSTEKASAVRGMFSAIAPRYDLLNHLLSLNIDKRWRRRAADFLLAGNSPGGHYLDSCAGTMDLAVEIARRSSFSGHVVASDFAFPMLAAGGHKLSRHAINAVCADALRLPFEGSLFSGAIVGFGVRNLASVEDGVHELTRVLRPGGRLVILEFTTPRWQPFRALYMLYFKRVLPLIGSLVSRHSTAYSYLPASVLEFPEPPVLATIMEAAGLVDVKWQTLTGGIVAIHSGLKGPSGNEDRERQSRENSLERGAISDFTG